MSEGAPKVEGKFEKPQLRQKLEKTARILGIAAAGYAAMPEGHAAAQTHDEDRQGQEEIQTGETSNAEHIKDAIGKLQQLTAELNEFDSSFLNRELLNDENALREKVVEAEELIERVLPESQRLREGIGARLLQMNDSEELALAMSSGDSLIKDAAVAKQSFEDSLVRLQTTIEDISTKLEGSLAMRIDDADTFRSELTQTTMGDETSLEAAEDLNEALVEQSAQAEIVREAQQSLDAYWQNNAGEVAKRLQDLGQDFSEEQVSENPEGFAKLLQKADSEGDYSYLFEQQEELRVYLSNQQEKLRSMVDAQQEAWNALPEEVDGVAELKALHRQLGEVDPEVQKLLEQTAE